MLLVICGHCLVTSSLTINETALIAARLTAEAVILVVTVSGV